MLLPLLLLVGCENSPELARSETMVIQGVGKFTPVWHAPSETCYMVFDPGGDGGGAITETNPRVCGHGVQTEPPVEALPSSVKGFPR
jgi:hypothetical protein